MPTILYTSKQLASKNIADELEKIGRINAIDTEVQTVLDIPTDFDADCEYVLVLSPHKSKVPKPMLTMHFPGNWGTAEMGGEPETLNIAHAGKLKQLFLETKRANVALGLNWEVTIEADHHGPTMTENAVPIIFVEIGSSEAEWGNKLAAQVLATAINGIIKIKNDEDSQKFRTFFGVGGGHYAKEFCRFVESEQGKEWAVGHIIPKYAIDNASESVLIQAIEKNMGRVEKAIILKDSLNAKQKEKILDFCKSHDVPAELI
ncbi:MAG: D-aminoacyl-tRNA deacylase [Candidatus Micrarchaeota archaeon]